MVHIYPFGLLPLSLHLLPPFLSLQKRLLESRKKSFSDSSLPVTSADCCLPREHEQELTTRQGARCAIPARDLHSPTIQGYVDRKLSGGAWEW